MAKKRKVLNKNKPKAVRKVGRPKNIESPELLWQYFNEYREAVKKNPILIHDFVGKDGEAVRREKERPLTMEAFENFLNDKEILADLSDYLENKESRYTEFVRICSRIRRTIRTNQIEGGMAGIFNPSITQRLNNLTEKTQISGDASNPIAIQITGMKIL